MGNVQALERVGELERRVIRVRDVGNRPASTHTSTRCDVARAETPVEKEVKTISCCATTPHDHREHRERTHSPPRFLGRARLRAVRPGSKKPSKYLRPHSVILMSAPRGRAPTKRTRESHSCLSVDRLATLGSRSWSEFWAIDLERESTIKQRGRETAAAAARATHSPAVTASSMPVGHESTALEQQQDSGFQHQNPHTHHQTIIIDGCTHRIMSSGNLMPLSDVSDGLLATFLHEKPQGTTMGGGTKTGKKGERLETYK